MFLSLFSLYLYVHNVFVVVLLASSRPKSCLLLRAGVPRLFNEIAFRLIGGVGSAGRSRCIICARWLLSCCSTSRLPLLTGSIHLREKNPSPSQKKTSTVGCINLASFAFYLRSFSEFHFSPADLPSGSSPDRMDRKRVNEKAAEAMESFFSELSKCLARRRGLFSLGGH